MKRILVNGSHLLTYLLIRILTCLEQRRGSGFYYALLSKIKSNDQYENF